MYKSKTHTCTHAVHTRTVHAGTQIDQQNTSAYSRWHWRVTVKCKPRDYSLRRWEERGGERSGGVLKRGRRRRKEGDKIGGRLICTKPGCCVSVDRIWHCWLFMLFQRPPAHQRQLLILSFFKLWFVLQVFILVLEEAIDTLNGCFSICLFVLVLCMSPQTLLNLILFFVQMHLSVKYQCVWTQSHWVLF